MPTKLASEVVQTDTLGGAKELLKQQIHEALNELASGRLVEKV